MLHSGWGWIKPLLDVGWALILDCTALRSFSRRVAGAGWDEHANLDTQEESSQELCFIIGLNF